MAHDTGANVTRPQSGQAPVSKIMHDRHESGLDWLACRPINLAEETGGHHRHLAPPPPAPAPSTAAEYDALEKIHDQASEMQIRPPNKLLKRKENN